MKRYESQLKALLGVLAKGYGIGLVVSMILAFLIEGGFSFSALGGGLLLDLFIGSFISIFMTSSVGMQNGIANMAVNAGKGLFRGLFAAGLGRNFGVLLFICKFFVFALIGGLLFTFAAISLPLTIIYTVIMYLIEKFKGPIDDSLADTLDKIVPVVAFIITAVLVYIVIKNGQ